MEPAMSRLLSLAVALALLPTAGCYTLELAQAGAASDNAKKNIAVEAVKSGQQIEITLRDGRQLEGKFRGFVREVDPVYLPRYSAFASTAELWLPRMGEVVTVALSRMTFAEFRQASRFGSPFAPQDYLFRGFDYGALVLAPVASTGEGNLGGGEIRMPVIDVADMATVSGQRVSGDDLRRLMAAGGVPLVSAVVVETESGSSVLALGDVRQILVRAGGHARLLGALIGLGGDLAVLSEMGSVFSLSGGSF